MEQLHQEAQLNLQSLLQGSKERGWDGLGEGGGWVLPGLGDHNDTVSSFPTCMSEPRLGRHQAAGVESLGSQPPVAPHQSLLPSCCCRYQSNLDQDCLLRPVGPPGHPGAPSQHSSRKGLGDLPLISLTGSMWPLILFPSSLWPRLSHGPGSDAPQASDEISSPAIRKLVISLSQPEQPCFPPVHSHQR